MKKSEKPTVLYLWSDLSDLLSSGTCSRERLERIRRAVERLERPTKR